MSTTRICDDGPMVNGGHLGGPDDAHYSRLAIQPIEVTEAWAVTWDSRIAYHLGESVAAIARCGTKGQAVRDLEKASWLLQRAAAVLRGDAGDPNEKRR
jgi:hypothetical protein